MTPMKQMRGLQRLRGVSLIEALVALAVMAFGMLGVVGMQTTLRSNADLSRQRAEAVRLAQEEIERVRDYSALRASDAGGRPAFEEIDSVAAAVIPASATNTEFTRATEVAASSASEPWTRHVRVAVDWVDRRDQPQTVELSTVVAGFPLQMAALPGMRTDRGPLQQPLGRNPAIPRGAVDLGDGTSRFVPPGGPSDRSWIFNNTTGLITRICAPSCTDTNRWLLSGIVAFATGSAPTAAEAASPGDAAFALGVSVALTDPGPPTPSPEVCTTELTSTRVNYFCAVPVNLDLRWSGRVRFSGFSLSSTLADNTATNYKVCRYTLDDRNWTGLALPPGESGPSYNSRHPYNYLQNRAPQVNKNFLVISAGDGTVAYACPDEDTTTLIETNTWPHDPPS